MGTAPGLCFDAVVVGAGPAGSAVAIELARAGWSVALIEKQSFPRRKVCGECIAASNLPLLQTLGLAKAFEVLAGPELRRVTLMHGTTAVLADLPSAQHKCHPWGRALGRETLDTLLLEQAQAAGAVVYQPCAVQAILGTPGAWHCEVRMLESQTLLRLRATVVVDAHGSWEDLPQDRRTQSQARGAADLFAFKANFRGAALPKGQITVLALDGGYGGMVSSAAGMTTVACCIRRDRLHMLRGPGSGLRASEAVEAWLLRECDGARRALRGAVRDGPWLASGPLNPGIRLRASDGLFRVGNAAGEAHPILGEGMSMALQSAALLCFHLLDRSSSARPPNPAAQAKLQHRYVAAWRREFVPRLRVAALFAHVAMRPRLAAAMVRLVRWWPGLLTQGARWGGKVRSVRRLLPPVLPTPMPAAPPAIRRPKAYLSNPHQEPT